MRLVTANSMFTYATGPPLADSSRLRLLRRQGPWTEQIGRWGYAEQTPPILENLVFNMTEDAKQCTPVRHG